MTRLSFFIQTALNNLRRGGQRVLVALLCVAFGVMSLVSMTLLSEAMKGMMVTEPRNMIGADISMDRIAEDAILPEHIVGLDALQEAGVIREYTLVAYSSSLAFRLPGSVELHYPGAGIGIDPAAYPPAGSLTVKSPGNAGLPTLLQEPGDMIISQDLVLDHGLEIGDTLILSDLTTGAPVEAQIRGIVVDTPNHQGSKLYYSLETAARLKAGGDYLNTVLALAEDPEKARGDLQAQGWRVFLATDLGRQDAQVIETFVAFLNGAGVLGLLVGGVGIANTMQVLLRRRQREVAIWKTLGYRSGDLIILFALEAGLLGLAGSIIGVALGIAVSAGLVDLFSRTSTMLIRWTLSPLPALLALFVGVVTAVVFALWAIVSTTRVVPAALLRRDLRTGSSLAWYQALGLILILSVPFTAVITLVMGSLLKAVVVLIVALSGMVVLGTGLAFVLGLITRLLPLNLIPLLRIGRSSLRRRGLGPVFAMIALFIGVVTLTFGGVVTQNAIRVLESSTLDIQGDNLTILAPAGEADKISTALEARGIEQYTVGYHTPVRLIRLEGDPEETYNPLLIARAVPTSEFTLQGEPWGSRPDGVYVPTFWNLPAGSRLEVVLDDGTVHTLTVAGSYALDTGRSFSMQFGLLLPNETSLAMALPEQVRFFTHVDPAILDQTVLELSSTVPQATVVNLVAHAARFALAYRNLFNLAVSMAGLALLAGVLLMANSVSLAVLDRRYDIGVLKAIGYSRAHVLLTLVLEYILIALVAAGAGLILVRGFLWLLSMQNQLAGNLMVLTPGAAAAVTLVTLGLTLLAVLASTWKPTQVSPVMVLNDRE